MLRKELRSSDSGGRVFEGLTWHLLKRDAVEGNFAQVPWIEAVDK